MASIERECELALINAVSAASVTSYTSEREGGRLLPNLTAKASLTNELLGPFTGVFGLSATLTYTSRADSVSRAGFDHEFATIVQQLYRSPSLASYMTSNSRLKVYKASINSEAGSIVATNRTWKREISISIQASTRIPDPSLLLHMDGTNGSTRFIDSSLNNFTITPYGNAEIRTAQYKFGGASGLFDRDDITYVGRASNSNFQFESDFTIEMWVYMIENDIGYQSFCSTHTDGLDATGWVFLLEGNGNIYFYGSDGTQSGPIGGWNCQIVTETYPDSEQWVHIAVVRYNNVIKIYKNGTDVTSAGYGTQSVSISGGQNLEIGHYTPLPEENKTPHCYIDELRIVKGYAAYTSNFTPSTKPFPNP
jgi:hypothetical protein